MGWEFKSTEDSATRNKGKAARRVKKSTGVKHINLTISGFSHEAPDAAESMLTRLNLRSNDPLSSGGGSGNALTAGEISAAFAMGAIRVPSVDALAGPNSSSRAAFDLAFYKHTGDRASWRGIYATSLLLLVSIAIKEGWADAKKDDRERGVMTSCAITAIEDVCAPRMFVDQTVRQWTAHLGLDNHMQWVRKWETRYKRLRGLIQELDMAAEEQIRRRV